MSATARRGSNAPYTVVPAVALTRKGTNPCAREEAPSNVKRVQRFFKIAGKNRGNAPCIMHMRISGAVRKLLKP